MRLVIAEDLMLTRVGIAASSRAGHEVVGEAEDLQGLLGRVTTTSPDAVITDIRMPPTQTDEGIVAAQEDPGRASTRLGARALPLRRTVLRAGA